MSALPAIDDASKYRARHWDAVVLGSGITSLIAAARLGMAGQRVLVVEEDAARALPPALREPFFLAGGRDQGVLDAVLKDLKIPLIDQRRIVNERLAYQIVSPKVRFDLGGPGITAHELVAWHLSDRESAGGLVRSLVEATEAERKILLTTPAVRVGRRLGMPRIASQGPQVRGLPGDVAQASPDLRALFDAQCSALSNLATGEPTPEGRARLLGSGLAGGAGFQDGPPWLQGLLRKRVESVHGEFRTLSGEFTLATVEGQPAIRVTDTNELWVGRALVLGAPTSALAQVFSSAVARSGATGRDARWPELLGPPRPYVRRLALHFRTSPDFIPRGMCPRVLLMREAELERATEGIITLGASANPNQPEQIDLVARMRVAPDDDEAERIREITQRLHALMPFSEDALVLRPYRRPSWDDDDWLEDPIDAGGWPSEVEIRVTGMPTVYRLDRAGVAGVGIEGDLLLGWRAGDALAAELG